MSRTTLAAGIVVLLVVVGATVGFAFGLGPAPGGAGTSEEVDDFPEQTSDDSGTDDGQSTASDDGDTQAASSPPFVFSIDRIEKCGPTCRDVMVTLHNEQNQTAENATVYTRIYAGNSTADDDRVWQGKKAVGTMDADSSVTKTQRVSLSYADGYAIKQNDGWVTIVTTVQSDGKTVTFEERRDVS